MGMKLGLSHKGKSIDWGCLRTGFWGEYLDLRGMWSMKISCTMRSFIMCTHPQILLSRSNQGGCDGRGMWHAWDRREKCTRFWWESPKGRDHSEDRVVDGRMGSELILGRLAVCVCGEDLVASVYGPVVGSFEHDDEPSGSGATELVG
jgi:hypothetical protein